MIFCCTYFCVVNTVIFFHFKFLIFQCSVRGQEKERYMQSGGGSLEPRTAIEGSFMAGGGGLGKLDRGLGRGETFFPDSYSDRDSNRDSDETFLISRKLCLVHVEFFCLLDSQL
jgi:hypothetical protein